MKHLQRLSLQICFACLSTTLFPVFLYPVFHHMMLLFLNLSVSYWNLLPVCFQYLPVAALGRTWGAHRALRSREAAEGSLLNHRVSSFWFFQGHCRDFVLNPLGLNCRLLGTGGCRVLCMGGDHELTCELWDPLKQPTAPRNFSYSEKHVVPQPGM